MEIKTAENCLADAIKKVIESKEFDWYEKRNIIASLIQGQRCYFEKHDYEELGDAFTIICEFFEDYETYDR